jgi:hypothetical protein
LALGENPKKYYNRSFTLRFNLKILIFYIICKIGFNKYLYYIKSKYSLFKKS